MQYHNENSKTPFLSSLNRRLNQNNNLSLNSPTNFNSNNANKPHFFKKTLTCLLMLPLMYAFNAQALTSNTTAQAINGSAPYLTFDNGQTKSDNTRALLWLRFNDGNQEVKYDAPPKDNNNNPVIITIPAAVNTFEDIQTVVSANTPIIDGVQSIDFSTILQDPNNYARDDDGDVVVSATGKIAMTILDSTEQKVRRTDAIDTCSAPYTINLKIDDSEIKTQYGIPDSTSYSKLEDNYYLAMNSATLYTCFVQPAKTVIRGNENGESGQWDNNKQIYFMQNLNQPELNFPATGAHNLYFKLIIAGLKNINQLSYTKEPSNSNIDLEFGELNKTPIVRLKGPTSNSTSWKIPFVPTTFTIYADTAKNKPIYSFKLQHWFIPHTDIHGYSYLENNHNNAVNYCSTLSGYRLANVSELSNANANGIVGNPNANAMYPIRQINGGLFSEWGGISGSYSQDKQWSGFAAWTATPSVTPGQFYTVSLESGIIHSFRNQLTQTVCVSP